MGALWIGTITPTTTETVLADTQEYDGQQIHTELQTLPTAATKKATGVATTATTATETNTEGVSRDWDTEDAKILLKIAMAEAEDESTEGKAELAAQAMPEEKLSA